MMRILATFLTFSFLAVPGAMAATFQVRHDHLLGSCTGDLVFTDAAVEYRASKTGHARAWKYEDIQQLELTPERISILTYEGRKFEPGDRSFHFKVLAGEVNEAFRRDMENRLTRPLVSSVIPEQAHARYTIPARRRRFRGGGSQGVLEFGERYLVYRAADAKDSQIWRYDDLQSIGTTGPFQLRVDNQVFDLKRRLRTEEYDFLWDKVNLPGISGR